MVSGCVCGALLMYWIMRKKAQYSPATEGQDNKKAQYTPATEGQDNVGPTAPAGPIYEEVSPKEEIELNTNQAYGPCSRTINDD